MICPRFEIPYRKIFVFEQYSVCLHPSAPAESVPEPMPPRETSSPETNYKTDIHIANTARWFGHAMLTAMDTRAKHKHASTSGYLQGEKSSKRLTQFNSPAQHCSSPSSPIAAAVVPNATPTTLAPAPPRHRHPSMRHPCKLPEPCKILSSDLRLPCGLSSRFLLPLFLATKTSPMSPPPLAAPLPG